MKKLLLTAMFLVGLTFVSLANETTENLVQVENYPSTQITSEPSLGTSLQTYLETQKSRRKSSSSSIFSMRNILIGALVVVIVVVGVATGTLTVNGQQV